MVTAVVVAVAVWPRPESQFLLGGIQVNEPDHETWIRGLKQNGLNTVAVTVYARQGDWDSANLWWDEESPWVLAEIRAAKRRGLNVVMVLRVALDHAFERNRFLWHGMIQPASEDELDEWFRRYRAFVSEWAVHSEREGVDVLAIGSELNSLTSTVALEEIPALEEYWSNDEKIEIETAKKLEYADSLEGRSFSTAGADAPYESVDTYLEELNKAHGDWAEGVLNGGEQTALTTLNGRRRRLADHWLRVIEEARASYSGRLTYAANFDQYEDVGFWPQLDLIGINAYFPLRDRWQPEIDRRELEAALEAGWRSVLGAIDDLRRRAGVPEHQVLFTELGYVSRRNNTIQPWAAEGFAVLEAAAGEELVLWQDQPHDLEERALALEALRTEQLELGGDLLAGILYWKLSTLPEHESIEPFVITLTGKPRDPGLVALTGFLN